MARRRDELSELVCDLIGFDTVTHVPGSGARQEADLQHALEARLRRRGAVVSVAEPDPAVVRGHAYVPAGFDFSGRPQLVARFAGTGGGRTLLLCGHVDVVPAGPMAAWSSHPFSGVIRAGAVWGRGACDMKGGVACMVLAAEVLADLGVRLAGDLIVNSVTDEESTGAGGLVSARTLRADAAIVPEPSRLAVWVTCRGSLMFTVDVEGRAGHAGIPPGPAASRGAVNAIEKLGPVLASIGQLRKEWARRPAHPYLAPADCVPTLVAGGEWMVSYPARCRLDCHVEFLPEQADDRGGGVLVQREIEDWIARSTAGDAWLRRFPPRIEWQGRGVPPASVAESEPIVQTMLGAEAALGRTPTLGGLDNWHDGATLIVEGGIPSVCYGPGDMRRAHAVDECVPVGELVACAQGIALAAMRFCGHGG